MALAVLGLLTLRIVRAGSESAPVILIYSPGAPLYAQELGRLIEEDGRIEADIRIVHSSDVFSVMLHYPTVKLAIVALYVSANQNIGSALDRFFSRGGALIGLGFAGSVQATGRAAETVFPIFGNHYIAGVFDTASRSFRMSHLKVQEDEISDGLGNFTVPDQKLVLSVDPVTKAYLPRTPPEGEYKVLYRELSSGAPSVVRYHNRGASVTFACFAGDDTEKGFSYFGRFTSTPEFRTLFTNAVYWAWNNEKRYEAAMSWSSGHAQRLREIEDAAERARERRRRREYGRILQVALTAILSAAAAIGVYWATFVKTQRMK